MTREVKVAIIGDARGFKSAVAEADSSLGKLGGGIAKFGKVAALGIAGAAVGVAAIGKKFYDEAIESQKVTKQTAAVVKSMGDVAGISAKGVAALSSKLSMQSGIDDELIQSGENVLLTFANVRNEIGKGNDVFTRATKVAVDMSVALGQDLKSSNIQLGKALNDPIKGVTALSRVGVSFTEQQKKQIKALVESGKTLEAQKIILGEVEKEFKGSAAAQATAGEKLKVIWGNLQETLGAKLIPVVNKVATFLANNLPKAMDAVGKAVKPVAAALAPFFKTLRTGFTEDEGTPIERFALKVRGFAETVKKYLPQVVAGFKAVVDWFQTNWPKISKVVGSVAKTIGSIVAGVVKVIQVLWKNFGNNILDLVKRIWPRIQQIIEGALKIIRSVVKVITSLIQGDWSGVWDGIKGIVTGAWQAIQGIIGGALELIRSIIGIALEVLGSIFKGAWDGITSVVSGAIDGIVGFVTGLPGRIASVAGTLWDGLLSGLDAVVGKIGGWLDSLGQKFIDVVNMAIRAYNAIRFLPDLPTIGGDSGAFPKGGIAKSVVQATGLPGLGTPTKTTVPFRRFDKGGIMPGRRGVHYPALVAGGETVLPTHRPGRFAAVSEVHYHFHGPVGSKAEMQRWVRDTEARAGRRAS